MLCCLQYLQLVKFGSLYHKDLLITSQLLKLQNVFLLKSMYALFSHDISLRKASGLSLQDYLVCIKITILREVAISTSLVLE